MIGSHRARMKSLLFVCVLLSAAVLSWTIVADDQEQKKADDGLRHDYYEKKCPHAESIIADMMEKFIQKDANVTARIIRMHFHDCWIRGCDASVLLNSTANNTAERDAPANNPSLQGFDIIDSLKESLERECPGVVSCADIIAYATRESVFQGGIRKRYKVRGGRRDGRVSVASEVTNGIPAPVFNLTGLIRSFAAKGFSQEELVTLSGAHSVGVSHCLPLVGRQFNLSDGNPDPLLDPNYAAQLRQVCPRQFDNGTTLAMDINTPYSLDNKYFEGLVQKKGLFISDAALLTNKATKKRVEEYAKNPGRWEEKFVAAMIKMGEIQVKTGDEGEVRKMCSVVN